MDKEQKWLRRVMAHEKYCKDKVLQCAAEGKKKYTVEWEILRVRASDLIDNHLMERLS